MAALTCDSRLWKRESGPFSVAGRSGKLMLTTPPDQEEAMLDQITFVLTVIAAVGAGMIGGIFYIFSITIVPALDRQPAEHAVAVMQAINRVILAPAFLVLFVGLVPLCVAVVALQPGDVLAWVGALLYVLGSFVLTRAVNVPLNNALDRAAGGGAPAWQAFRPRWTVSNHVRTAASVASAVLLTLAA